MAEANLDLIRAPYALYGVKYTDLVSLTPFQVCARRMAEANLDLIRVPYALYGVKYTDLVSLTAFQVCARRMARYGPPSTFRHAAHGGAWRSQSLNSGPLPAGGRALVGE